MQFIYKQVFKIFKGKEQKIRSTINSRQTSVFLKFSTIDVH